MFISEKHCTSFYPCSLLNLLFEQPLIPQVHPEPRPRLCFWYKSMSWVEVWLVVHLPTMHKVLVPSLYCNKVKDRKVFQSAKILLIFIFYVFNFFWVGVLPSYRYVHHMCELDSWVLPCRSWELNLGPQKNSQCQRLSQLPSSLFYFF